MVKDRLQEMKKKHEEFESEDLKKKRKKKEKETMETTIAGFQDKVHGIEERLKSLKKEADDVKKLQSNLYCSPFVTSKDLQKMEHMSDQILTDSIRIRKDIELLAAETTTESQKASLITSGTHQRVHVTQIDRLSQELKTTTHDFAGNQADYLDKTKARFKRQMQIVTNGNEPDNIDMNFQNQAMFTGGFLMEMQKAKGDLQVLQEREEVLHDIEGQIHEVNKLFKEMHVLVADQGETIDTIENHVERTVADIESGKKDLGEAEKNQKKFRKKKCICIIILVIVIAIIIGIVAAIIAQSTGGD
ncbi:syntaxin-1A-like [Mizuhopecten yessoensis]|uniref:syntaxin-1A-like n=1 Tax=Mizuhopecten yessoensis TaxID=6573 RepID=UPI000B45F5CA|nr:syntaxin-1A-like [Mizuhopecten yessoensis]